MARHVKGLAIDMEHRDPITAVVGLRVVIGDAGDVIADDQRIALSTVGQAVVKCADISSGARIAIPSASS
ncbi:hypothetical protein M2189_006768 [Bradyrhizobium japonicum]|nr:hypothetical protein [Bradyrhizobium japonicum]MCS3963565.1 hypothetical protein [Bradyrhizobium japonicum]MCS3995878.1 hypothetical protein [Bradyrhizobium japonicum]